MYSLVPLLDRKKASLPTMVGGRVLWHLSYTEPTSAVAFTQSYGECQCAAAQQQPCDRVREVLIGAFDSTSTSVRSLCSGACLGNCLLHVVNYASQLRPVKLSYWACWRSPSNIATSFSPACSSPCRKAESSSMTSSIATHVGIVLQTLRGKGRHPNSGQRLPYCLSLLAVPGNPGIFPNSMKGTAPPDTCGKLPFHRSILL